MPPFPQYVFMEWCSVTKEAQRQLYLYNVWEQKHELDRKGEYFEEYHGKG